jgi:hypothetical protein
MRNKIFKIIVAAGILIVSLAMVPEVYMLSALIDAIGLDAIAMLVEAQVVVFFYTYFGQHIMKFFRWANTKLEKIDPYYFIPSKNMVKQYPQIILHAFPFLVTSIVASYVGLSAYE